MIGMFPSGMGTGPTRVGVDAGVGVGVGVCPIVGPVLGFIGDGDGVDVGAVGVISVDGAVSGTVSSEGG